MTIRARLLATSGLIFASRIVGAAVMFAVQALIARHFGSASLGQYMVAVATINILAMILPLGFQTIATYFAAAYAARKQGYNLRCFMREAMLQTLLTAIVSLLGVLLLVRAGWLSLSYSLATVAAIIVSAAAVAFIMLSGAILTALKHPVLGMTSDALLRPLLVALALTLSVFTIASGDVVDGMLRVQSALFACLASAVVVVTVLVARKLYGDGGFDRLERRRWWFYAAPWTIVALASDFFFDIDTLHLTRFLSYSDLAIFGVACRLFSLAAFAVGTVYAVSMPDIFEAEANGGRDEFIRRIRLINRTAAGLALAIVLGAPMFAPWLLQLVGAEFEAATAPLSILCLVLLVRSVMGPAALILSLEKRPYVQLWAVAAGLVALVAGNHILVPWLGLYGACYSALIATTVWSVTMWGLALRLTGIDVSIGLWPTRTARTGAISTSAGQ